MEREIERERNMDIHRDKLPEHRGKRIHQQPKMVSLRTRIPSGKENISPSPSCDSNVPWESRSPLPEGFPRVPLQDITDILSPVNQVKAEGEAQGQDDAGQGGQKRKKTKNGSLNVHLPVNSGTHKPLKSRWEGLTQCLTVGESADGETSLPQCLTVGESANGETSLPQCLTVGETANEETEIKLKGQTAKAEEVMVKAEDKEAGTDQVKEAGVEMRDSKMGPNAEEGNIREQKRRRHPPTSIRSLTDSKGRSNVLKFR